MADLRVNLESDKAEESDDKEQIEEVAWSPTQRNEGFSLQFEPGNPEDPRNFRFLRKVWYTFILSMLAFLGLFGTSVIAPAEPVLAVYVNASIEVMTLLAALFLLGFAFGPLIWGPLSEYYGRRLSMLPATFVFGLFSIGSAVSKNLGSLLVTRFFAGLFASAATSIGPASLGDVFEPRVRATAMGFWIEFVIAGPTMAPVIGAAAIANKNLGWRWTEYVEAILVFFVFSVAFLTMPETYTPVLLKQRTKRVSKSAGPSEPSFEGIQDNTSFKSVFKVHLTRPIRMVLTEPILVCISLYTAFVYAIPFMVFQFFPIVFAQERHWGRVVSTLPFLSILVGSIVGTAVNIAVQPWYVEAVKKNNGRAVPEARLPPIIIGAAFLSSGLFWFGWTATPKILWVSPTMAGSFIGAGFTIAFQQCLNFVVDLYGPYAASAIAINTFMRSVIAAGLTLAARPMFLRMGVAHACSVLGGISCIAFPIPFILVKYGTRLRKRSKFAPPLQ